MIDQQSDINGLPDMRAADQKTAAQVVGNFKQVAKSGSLRLHPVVSAMLDEDTLKALGAERMGRAKS